jgi:hypothetical protein
MSRNSSHAVRRRRRAKPLPAGILYITLAGTLFAVRGADRLSWYVAWAGVVISIYLLFTAVLESEMVSSKAKKTGQWMERKYNHTMLVVATMVNNIRKRGYCLCCGVKKGIHSMHDFIVEQSTMYEEGAVALFLIWIALVTGMIKLHGIGKEIFQAVAIVWAFALLVDMCLECLRSRRVSKTGPGVEVDDVDAEVEEIAESISILR